MSSYCRPVLNTLLFDLSQEQKTKFSKYLQNITEVSEVPGLYYIENVIEANDDAAIMEELDKHQWKAVPRGKRLVQHYGYEYGYASTKVKSITQKIPETLQIQKQKLTAVCQDWGLISDKDEFNQCIVNKYEVGEKIGAHIDSLAFGRVVGCFTLKGGATMRFKRDDHRFDIYVEPNSLYIMSGDARYKWTHEMLPNKSKLRVSLTYRIVN